MRVSSLIAVGLAAVFAIAAPCAQAADSPYEVIVWAKARYDAAGTLTSLEFPHASDYSPALLGNLRSRIAARPIDPKLDGDVPATYETGVRVALTITPDTGTVAVDDISDIPLVLRMTKAQFTQDVSANPAWDGRVLASCTVSVKGRCGAVDILSGTAQAPEEARRFAKASLAGWRFEPQKIAGKPIEGQVIVPFLIERAGVSRPTLRGRNY